MRPSWHSVAAAALSAFVFVSALADTPLEWTNLRLKTQQGGNAEIELMRSFDGMLLVAKVRIHSNASPIEVPTGCWPSGRSIYYDNVLVAHGALPDGQKSWKFSFNVDEPLSANSRARFYLVVNADAFQSSYIEYLDTNGVLIRNPLCNTES